MKTWQVQEAKAHFSELLRASDTAGPQAITWHGQQVAVLVSQADYERLTGSAQSLVSFMRYSPLFGAEDLDFSRDQTPVRDVSL